MDYNQQIEKLLAALNWLIEKCMDSSTFGAENTEESKSLDFAIQTVKDVTGRDYDDQI